MINAASKASSLEQTTEDNRPSPTKGMSRYAACAIHFGISLVIFVVLAYFVIFEWYPGFFFETDGGWRGMRIIVAVDLILGPMLTLVVYKHGKPGLKTDLFLIGLLQFACLFAGTYVVYAERPLAVVYVDGRFTVMSNDDYTQDAQTAAPDLDNLPGDDPKWVSVDIPTGVEEETDFRARYIGKRPLSSVTENYIPFDVTDDRFINQAVDLEILRNRPDGNEAFSKWVKEHGGAIEDYRFYLFTTRYAYKYAGFHADGTLLGFMDVKVR